MIYQNRIIQLLLCLCSTLIIGCVTEKKLAERKLIVNYKDSVDIYTSLLPHNFEPLYYSQQAINLYKTTNNIAVDSEAKKEKVVKENNKIFFHQILPTLDSLSNELNHSVIVMAKSRRKRKKLKQELERDPNVVFVQENEPQMLYYYPNDPYYSSLWGISKIKCNQAWDLSEGDNITIAVIDDGTFLNHNDIRNNLWIGPSGENGYDLGGMGTLNPSPGTFHGTHVAGTIAATGNNNLGIIGVAPKAKILTLKAAPNMDDIKCAQAFNIAMTTDAKVINNSWGPIGRRPVNQEISRLIDMAYRRNITVVFAAGNSNDDVQYYAPQNHPRVITVGATDEIDNRCSFSNYGNLVSVSAPGNNIHSLNASANGIVTLSGTSMAAPHVSGLVALLLKINPKLTPEQIKLLIENSAKPITTDRPMGFGRIDAYNAVYQAIVTQRHIIKINFDGLLRDQDDHSEDEYCWFDIPFEISLLADGQMNTGELTTARCDNEVWANTFYSCSMDFNKTLDFAGTVNLYDADNFQGSQTFNIRVQFGRTGNIVTGSVADEDGEDWVSYTFTVKSFE